uniref:Spc7 kinetochore protein domain-containing protein n=1 Tax=Moniliophthora roreri TaxID=221103 RepID=A0A0W0F5T4_MONRR
MVVSNDRLSRRKSIAAPQASSGLKPTDTRRKRRAHSIAPGKIISPLSRSRQSLGPIKGILKGVKRLSEATSTSSSQPQTLDETQSMDFTQVDSSQPIENTSRQSMARRVSFYDYAHVRLFERNHTSSSAGSLESPGPPSSDDGPPNSHEPQTPTPVNDENAYPGAPNQRRSLRFSTAVSDMDMTSASAGGFLNDDESALLDEELELSDEDDAMDVTDVHGHVVRKRSLSMGGKRAPLSQISSNPPDEGEPSSDGPHSRFAEEASQSFMSEQSVNSDQSGMEYTIPLNQALRPAQQDEAWLALVKVTHSGQAGSEEASLDIDDVDITGEDMDLDSPVKQPSRPGTSGDDSMSDGSFDIDGADDGNETINVSKVLGRFSFGDHTRRSSISVGVLGGDDGNESRNVNASRILPRFSFSDRTRQSVGGYGDDSAMEESEVYGEIGALAMSTPRPSVLPPNEPSSPLPEEENEVQPELEPVPSPEATVEPHPPQASGIPPPKVFSHPKSIPKPTNRPPSPKKIPVFTPKSPGKSAPKGFSAAFAPPVTKPTPKKPSSATSTLTSTPSVSTVPEKRPHSAEDKDAEKPSPAKRQALANRWTNATTTTQQPAANTSQTESPAPRPLSPAKKAIFQAPASSTSTTSSIRRPSGYFARRKSLAVGLGGAATPVADDQPSVAPASPKKKAGVGLGIGRASVGSAGSADAWKRFDRDAEPITTGNRKGKERAVEPGVEQGHAPSPVRTPSPVRASPVPSPKPQPPAKSTHDEEPEAGPSTSTQVVDLSALLEPGEELYNDNLMETDLVATEQWREGVAHEGVGPDDEDIPTITIEQFFEMTGIKFMDELTAPRKSIHPSQLKRQPRPPAEIPLAEYAVAMGIDVPQLTLYSRVSKDLEAWMEQSKVIFEQAEEEAAKMTPELFVEYSRVDEEGQQELLHQLSLIRTNTRLLAKADWYEWKHQWIEGLKATAQESFMNLESDARVLEQLKHKADELVPALQQEYDEIMRELEREQAEVAELEQCDHDYLNELKTSIAEQSVEVDSLKNELKEGNDQLKWLEERLEELESQKREATSAIAEADRFLQIQKNSTHAEVLRLRDELEALENLHMFRVCKVNANLFEYVHASRFRVTIPCKNYIPLVEKVDISRMPDARSKLKDDFPRLSDFLLMGAKQLVRDADVSSTRQIVHLLNGYWSSCTQLRGQLMHLSVKYPVEIEVPRSLSGKLLFKANAAVLFPSVKGKAIISFVFDADSYSRWPASISSLRCEVGVAYGSLDGQAILNAVQERLSQATPSDNYACLLDACIEAQEQCGR